MSKRNYELVKAYAPGAAFGRYLIMKFSAPNTVVVGAAATDILIGVSTDIDTAATDVVGDVVRDGIAPVFYGGTVAVGDRLTSNGVGRAIATVTAGNFFIGIAEVAGVTGDIGSVKIASGYV